MEVELRVTNACQLTCKHCYVDAGPNPKQKIFWDKSTFDSVYEFLRHLKNLIATNDGKVSLRISGGEPLLLDFEVLKYAVEKANAVLNFPSFGLITNFLAFNEDVYRLCKENGFIVFVSYDPVVRFENQNVERFWEDKVKKFVPKDPNLYVASVVVTKLLQKFNVVERLSNLGFKTVYLAPLATSGRGRRVYEALSVSREEYVRLVSSILDEAKKRTVKVIPFDDFKFAYEKHLIQKQYYSGIECWGECYNDFGINPDLSVSMLGLCFSEKPYGFVEKGNEEESAKKIWLSELRKEFTKAKLTRTECFGCEYYSFCRGGCFTVARMPYKKECQGLKSLLKNFLKN